MQQIGYVFLNRIKFVAFWLGLTGAFTLTAAYIVTLALGYKVNFKTRQVQKTALVAIKTTPREAIIYLNGKPIGEKTPLRKSKLLPGLSEIKIEKAGYQTWQQSLNLEEGRAYDLTNVVLFLKDPVLGAPQDQSAPMPSADDFNLYFSGGEIWYKDKLVTRLSQEIKNAIVYPDKAHIVFQVDGEIRIVEATGTNNTLLVKLDSTENSVFGLASDNLLVFKDGSKIKQAKIF